MTPKRITLESFARRYSSANQTEMDIARAAVSKLNPNSDAHKLAVNCVKAWSELEEYLEAAGWEL